MHSNILQSRHSIFFLYQSYCEWKHSNFSKIMILPWFSQTQRVSINILYKDEDIDERNCTLTIKRLTLLTKTLEGSMLLKSSVSASKFLRWFVVPLERGISEGLVMENLVKPFCKVPMLFSSLFWSEWKKEVMMWALVQKTRAFKGLGFWGLSFTN